MTESRRTAGNGDTGRARTSTAATIHNIVAVGRREYAFRAKTRAFRITTALLVLVTIALASAPIIIRWVDRGSTGDRIEVFLDASDAAIDVPQALDAIMNAPLIPGSAPDPTPAYRIETTTDEAAARADVESGDAAGLLVVSRSATGDLDFTFVAKDGSFSRKAQLVRGAVSSIAIQDRLARAGFSPTDQAALFAPPSYAFESAKSSSIGGGSGSAESFANSFTVSFALAILLFMAIILYGQWVAFSVAEEKNSRVMEVVLAAATPFQLLAGKVVGVGALALTQYVIILVPAAITLFFQDQIAAFVLGESGAAAQLPAGLTVPLMVVFGVMFVLGFALYAVLYAGAASLVSRQEDVNQIVAPLTFISVGGYIVASYAGTGLIPIDSPLVVILSFVPFFSPYLMLTRYGQGAAGLLEVALAMVLLALFIPVALWVAARLYRTGVLLYGQRPTPRTLLRGLRGR